MINKIDYLIERVDGLHCPAKFLVIINNQTVCFTNSKNSAKNIIEYAVDLDESRLEDNKIKRIIKRIINDTKNGDKHEY